MSTFPDTFILKQWQLNAFFTLGLKGKEPFQICSTRKEGCWGLPGPGDTEPLGRMVDSSDPAETSTKHVPDADGQE